MPVTEEMKALRQLPPLDLPFRGAIKRSQLWTAERGVYVVEGSEILNDRFWNPVTSTDYEGPSVLIGRIDGGFYMPQAVVEARRRPDGMRLIVARCPYHQELRDGTARFVEHRGY